MVGYDKDRELSNTKYIIAGAAAGIITRGLFQPLDVVKIKFQLQVEPVAKSSLKSKYQGISHALKTIFKEEGVRGLWSGHNAGQVLSIIYGFVNFTSFEYLTKKFSDDKTVASHFICGTASSSLATVAAYPFDTVRTRFVAQGKKKGSQLVYKTMYGGLLTMLKQEGITAPFKGVTPTLLQAAPLGGITFLVHNVVSKLINENQYLSSANKVLNLQGNVIAGGVSGFVAKTVVYPLDLVRKRMQFQGFQNARQGYGLNFICQGLYSCLVKTVKNEGFLGLFKGWVPSVLKATLTTACHFTVYEETCKMLGKF